MYGITQWLSQVASITWFNLCSIPERKGASATTIIGIAGVVTVFVGVLSIAEGFRETMAHSGGRDVAIVLRSGADSEMTSGLTRDDVRLIKDSEAIARGPEGPMASAELYVIINLPKRSSGTDANVPLRGVESGAYAVRDNIRLEKGRRFETGRNEVIVGIGAAREYAGMEVGRKIKVGQNEWEVVGIFSAGGGLAESEIWTDAAVLQPAYHRGDSFQVVHARLKSAAAFNGFKDFLTANPQLQVKVSRQDEYYAEQSAVMTTLIKTIGFFVAALMALGALFGALNTMYSAVASRSREIATLRALGFGASPVILSILFESLLLALAGGTIGAAGAFWAFNGFQAATMNFQTFSRVAFAFSVTPELIAGAIVLATVIGLFGGLFPAVRAARIPIAAGLRDI